MQAGKVYFDEKAPWFRELQKEFLKFPATKHDDQVDATAWAVRLTLTKSAPKEEEEKKLPSWRDKLNGVKRGDSHMAA